jgi:hypothetical protein
LGDAYVLTAGLVGDPRVYHGERFSFGHFHVYHVFAGSERCGGEKDDKYFISGDVSFHFD